VRTSFVEPFVTDPGFGPNQRLDSTLDSCTCQSLLPSGRRRFDLCIEDGLSFGHCGSDAWVVPMTRLTLPDRNSQSRKRLLEKTSGWERLTRAMGLILSGKAVPGVEEIKARSNAGGARMILPGDSDASGAGSRRTPQPQPQPGKGASRGQRRVRQSARCEGELPYEK
jgi:hypothetical protein